MKKIKIMPTLNKDKLFFALNWIFSLGKCTLKKKKKHYNHCIANEESDSEKLRKSLLVRSRGCVSNLDDCMVKTLTFQIGKVSFIWDEFRRFFLNYILILNYISFII